MRPYSLLGCVLGVVVIACSSSTNPTCSSPPFLSTACTTCLASACQADTQACNENNAFTDCYCSCAGNGGSVASCTQSCASSSCQAAVTSCIQTNIVSGGACASACSTGSGPGPDAGGTGWVSCYSPNTGSTPGCAMALLNPSGQTSFNNTCTSNGETPGTTCPTSGLAGCCVLSASATCAYGTQGPDVQAACAQMGGTYQTTPP